MTVHAQDAQVLWPLIPDVSVVIVVRYQLRFRAAVRAAVLVPLERLDSTLTPLRRAQPYPVHALPVVVVLTAWCQAAGRE